MTPTTTHYITTTRLAEKLELDRSFLFRHLNDIGWLARENNRWVLTNLGKEKGGETRVIQNKGEFVVWPENSHIEELLRKQLIGSHNTDEINDANEFSEGEAYIAEYFDAINIQYREQTYIEGLSDRYANYRVADFYLPKYKVYVEFAGRWNRSKLDRERYRAKQKVYRENKVPCIWLYPDNLGVLHYIFHKRLKQVLTTHSLERGLFKYRMGQLLYKHGDNVIGLAIGGVLLYYNNPFENWFLVGFAIIGFNLFRLSTALDQIRRGKSVSISRLNRWED